MGFCKVIADWNSHSDIEAKKEDYANEIETTASKIYDDLITGYTVWSNNYNEKRPVETWDLQDFISEVSIDSFQFGDFLRNSNEPNKFKESMLDKLDKYSIKIAKELLVE